MPNRRRLKSIKKRPLWVIKAGSNMVIAGGPELIRDWMNQVKRLSSRHGIDVIWVTSGAIATARKQTKRQAAKQKTPASLSEKQAFSALGQPMVMNLYNLALRKHGLLGAQVLLTADDLADAQHRRNLIETLSTLLSWKVLPVLNENDAVSTEEIQFGDNDRLSALVAIHMKADRLVLLTDVDGLYDADPRKNPEARLVRELSNISNKLVSSLSSDSPSGQGTGGMLSKILASRTASSRGITTHLVRGNWPNAILKIAAGVEPGRTDTPGTVIKAKTLSRSNRRLK